jgi:5-methylcytosine-specific restriction endonuclease McrA
MKTLLLNSSYEVLSFIPERRLFKFLYSEKVEVVSTWDEKLKWGNSYIEVPAVVRLKHPVKRRHMKVSFSRQALLHRDNNICQYCGRSLKRSEVTIDHIIPKKMGGQSNFTNCVVACVSCNSKKSHKLMSEVNMSLIKQPVSPSYSMMVKKELRDAKWHTDWNNYL